MQPPLKYTKALFQIPPPSPPISPMPLAIFPFMGTSSWVITESSSFISARVGQGGKIPERPSGSGGPKREIPDGGKGSEEASHGPEEGSGA